MRVKFKAYVVRNRVLKALGFPCYQAYLNSDLWAKIRRAKLKQHPECFACHRPATQVHHTNYSVPVLLGHDLSSLKTVCGGCHYRSEFNEDGDKRTIRKANSALYRRKAELRFNPAKLMGAFLFTTFDDNSVDADYRRRMERD